jgi:hypothetical protein
MAIIATAGGDGKTFAPAPAGVHQAVAVDVIDKGMHPNKFKPGTSQHKIDIAWQINKTRDDGKRFLVYKRYTLSLNEKATLRHDLESWRGRQFTREEELGFDVENILGANCLINVQHNVTDKGTFANVVSVMPLVEGMPKMAGSDYVRVVDRPDTDNGNGHDSQVGEQPPTPVTDDDIPF